MVVLSIFPLNIYATSYTERSLDFLVNNSDLIVLGFVVKVDMVDYKGQKVSDPEAMTGLTYYELDNTLQLHVKVSEILTKKKDVFKDQIIVVKISGRRLKLSYVKEDYEKKNGIFLLSSHRKYSPTSGRYIVTSVKEKENIQIQLFCKSIGC